MRKPSRGQVWRANLSPTKGHETHGTRLCLIITVDRFNHGPADLVVVLPLTTTEKSIPFHVLVNPPEGGLSKRSFIKSEQLRCISKQRLVEYIGDIAASTMEEVSDYVRILLDL
ncbi:type II toxin-antitoxin system PemK/MazF family toxin [Candidatus Bipolaricaulota bacterium]|nr:type II toxin-antitoxin system PemK/MazF family toxin [Candidatus Bipolaricaulota bacterium]